MRRSIFTLILPLIFISVSRGQQEFGTAFLSGLNQSNWANPSFFNNDRLVISLPSFFYNLSHTGATVNQLIHINNAGEKVFDLGRVLPEFDDTNVVKANINLSTFGIAYQVEKWQLSFRHEVWHSAYSKYSKDLLELAWNGNAQYLDETVEFAPDASLTSYHSLGFGAAYQLADKFTLGARVKWLNGIANLSTPSSDASVLTDANVYELTFETDFQINSSSLLDIDGLTDVAFRMKYLSIFNNPGLAIDLGASWQINDNLQVGASVLDIGQIKWKTKVRNYTTTGTHVYEGLNLSHIIRSDSISFAGTLDTLAEILGFDETNFNYTTQLPHRYLLSGSYRANEDWLFGILLYGENFRNEFTPGLALSARARINEQLLLGGHYTIRNQTYFNFGFSAIYLWRFVQFYLVTDNILTGFLPYSSQQANGRIGANLLF